MVAIDTEDAEEKKGFVMKEAKDLSPEDVLLPFNLPKMEGESRYNHSIVNSSLVPHYNSTMEVKVCWAKMLISDKGSIYKRNVCYLHDTDLNYLTRVRYLFQTMGIQSQMEALFNNRYRLSFKVPNSFNMICPSYSAEKPLEYSVRVTKVKELPGLHDTYCFTESERGMGMFNGVLLGNCAEIVEYTDPQSVAVCNLASIALHKFVKGDQDQKFFDFEAMVRVVRIMVRNLNKVIDRTHYPVTEGKSNNLSYRPIGMGVQGLADVFAMMGLSWEETKDDGTKQINSKAKALHNEIFATLYHTALDESANLAQEYGSYDKFEGSPASQGILQYHMWGIENHGMFDEAFVYKIKKGLRNSLLIALMPTASSSQILQSNECFEPFTSNIYSRSTNSGEFIVVNRHLHKDLKKLGLWNKTLVDQIIADNGSIQQLTDIPQEIRDRYLTVWEMSQKTIIDFAAERSPYVDQTQSMNLFIERPTFSKLSSMHMYAWKKGLKTGSYYIRSRPARDAVKFTIKSTSTQAQTVAPPVRKFVCVGAEGCENCSA